MTLIRESLDRHGPYTKSPEKACPKGVYAATSLKDLAIGMQMPGIRVGFFARTDRFSKIAQNYAGRVKKDWAFAGFEPQGPGRLLFTGKYFSPLFSMEEDDLALWQHIQDDGRNLIEVNVGYSLLQSFVYLYTPEWKGRVHTDGPELRKIIPEKANGALQVVVPYCEASTEFVLDDTFSPPPLSITAHEMDDVPHIAPEVTNARLAAVYTFVRNQSPQ